ncbi:cytochrome c biogenesis CcdA family protein [Streptococcus sp. CSL10205-OR2]|uniref:cytochrome c biogenesis CcdA family protein n=1 Tax=Streptococcus sp. CSL10205-OR2 TaxID=2980558 RepID=UPI0021DAC973|nr:cytochrome c biogenesis protein CcdA [Streptococcus sp. CSL10205-OR2]MCU9534326.1 cytochrome c biogenesis protein CcdA [Streptococcus sp. CSL10205-OR2]
MAIQNITLFALFLEGILSFFSPCVLPILPIYIGILAGDSDKDSQDRLAKRQKRVLINTLCFISGIALTFFILAFASSLLSRFLNEHLKFLQIISGILMIAMGLFQMGWLKIDFLLREFSAKQSIYKVGQKVGPLLAFLLGFTFSFSWSPCIGPILASVFFYASSHQGSLSIILLLVYSIGFMLPFLLVAIFSQKMLQFFKQQVKFVSYTKIISGLILLVIGVSILTGSFTVFMNYLI